MAETTLPQTIEVEDDAPANALHGLNRLSVAKQVGLLSAVAAAIALGVTIAMWAMSPGFVPVLSNVPHADMNEVSQLLTKEGIAFESDFQSGSFAVAEEDLNRVRMLVSTLDLLKNGGQFTRQMPEFTIFTTEAEKEIIFREFLEDDIAKTISDMDGIHSATVEIASPKQSSFPDRDTEPSAGVVVRTRQGQMLSPEQGLAIATFVADSVDRLGVDRVSVTDHKFRTIYPTRGNGPGGIDPLDFKAKVEQATQEKVLEVLDQVMGPQNASVQVTAFVDFTEVAKTSVEYGPNAVVGSTSKKSSTRGGGPNGIPGSVTEAPGNPAAAPEEGAAEVQAAEATNTTYTQEEVVNSNVDETITNVRPQPGKLRRLSTAVTLNHKKVVAEDGSVRHVAPTPEELSAWAARIKAAIGFDPERGDLFHISGAPFAELPAAEAVPELPIWQQPWVLKLAKQAGAWLLVLILIFTVLRPIMKNLTGRELAERALAEAEKKRLLEAQAAAEASEVNKSGGAGNAMNGEEGEVDENGEPISPLQLTDDSDREQQIEAIRSLIEQDPGRVATVFKEWVTADAA